MSLNFELYLENDNSQSLCSFIYQLARVLKWSVLASVTSLISIVVLLSVIAPSQMPNHCQARKPGKTNWSCRALATYKLQTPFSALVQKPETRKMNEFFYRNKFFFFCFSFLLFGLKFRATGILCFPNNRKCKSDRMLNFSLMRSAQRKASCCFMADGSRFFQFSESFYLRDVKNDLLWSCNGRPCRNSESMVVFSRLIRRRS